jgi:glucose-6-phosphate isomerase
MSNTTLSPSLLEAAHLHPAIRLRLRALDSTGFASALWRKDARAWTRRPEVQELIGHRLGWLSAPRDFRDAIPRIRDFASSVRRDGFTDVVLLGMGGSSLAPEVLSSVVGISPGWPRFRTLDTVNPDAIRAVAVRLETTLFLFASKSGSTIEPNCLAAHFRRQLVGAGRNWAAHFVAITDEGTSLHRRAVEDGFRDLFINPPDIGGRYSALSFFGLVPAALMGVDIARLIDWAVAMADACGPEVPVDQNPGILLGVGMAVAAEAGCNKLTLLTAESLEPLGLWIEQLVAESTGKEGKGIIPIVGEPLGTSGEYGPDRFFVEIDWEENALPRVVPPGSPTTRMLLPDRLALGAEFFRWEVATAAAGAILRVNPFDEPNVRQAKEATGVLLESFRRNGELPTPGFQASVAGVPAALSGAGILALGARTPDAFLTLLGPGDFFALLAYLDPDSPLVGPLQRLRLELRRLSRCATTFSFGPRYLHSSGQLHKGGPDNGLFVIVTRTPDGDVAVPGEAYSFGTLELAQAIGDFHSLDREGRRAVHFHLPTPEEGRLEELCDRLLGAFTVPREPSAPWDRLST